MRALAWIRVASIAIVGAACGCSWLVTQPASNDAPAIAALVAPQRLAPAPTDAIPAERGSPTGSLARRPSWRVGDPGYAPGVSASEAAALFAVASAGTVSRTTLDGELLACRIDVQFQEIKNWSLRPQKWAAADLLIFVGFGPQGATSDGRLATTAANQQNHAYFVVPAARLAEGQGIDVLVNDRDRLVATDYVDRVALPWAGVTPLVATTAVSSVVCRVVEDRALADVVQTKLWDVDDALVSWRRSEVDIRDGAAACAAPEALTARIGALASILGWDDPRTIARLDAAASTEAAVAQGCAERFAAWVGALDPAGVPATLGGADVGVRVQDGSCAAAAMARIEATAGRRPGARCTFALEVTNRGSTPIPLDGGANVHPAWSVLAFDARGRELDTHGAARPRSIAGDAVTRLEFTTGAARSHGVFAAHEELASPPVLVELREVVDGGRRVRLRLPTLASQ